MPTNRSDFMFWHIFLLRTELESVKPPPDMTTFLQEERRLEKLLYRQSICSESDSTQGESRDSGVELDKNQTDENSWIPETVHSRQDSEVFICVVNSFNVFQVLNRVSWRIVFICSSYG